MPPARDGLVLVRGHHHAGQGPGQVALQVRQHQVIVVAGGEQVVGVGREPDAAHVAGVHLELLHGSPAADVVQHNAGVLVPGHQQPPAGVHLKRRDFD